MRLTAIAAAIAFTCANASLQISYNPEHIEGVNGESIMQDFKLMAQYFEIVRVYTSGYGSCNYITVAAATNIKILVGIPMGDEKSVLAEIAAVCASAEKNNGTVYAVSIANENLNETNLGSIVRYIEEARRCLPSNVTVSTAQRNGDWLKYGERLRPIVSVIFANIYSFFDGNKATFHSFDAQYAELQKKFPEMQIIVTETGWPSAGGYSGSNEASIQGFVSFFDDLCKWIKKTKVQVFYFIMFDLIHPSGSEFEKFFGLFTKDSKAKTKLNPRATISSSGSHSSLGSDSSTLGSHAGTAGPKTRRLESNTPEVNFISLAV